MIKEIPFENHDEWLEIRKAYIGGSDAGSVVGMNPYKSAYTLWAEKTGQIEAFAGNLTTEVGAYLEELVAELFTRETGKKVRKKNRTMVNDKYPFACANVDRMVVGEKAFLEIKTTNSLPIMRALKNGGDEFPTAYYAQCVHYLGVTGLERCYLAVLINCRELKIYTMERDEAEIAALMKAESDFWWNYVMGGCPPPVDGSEDCAETIETLHQEGMDRHDVTLMGLEPQIRAYLSFGERIKELKAAQTEAANAIKQSMGDASYGRAGAYKVSWTSSSRSTFDRDKFQKANPGVDLTPYYKTSASRTFRVTEQKI